jgi:hypothetical protein
MENLNRMTEAEEKLITPIIDAQVLFEIINEEYNHYYDSEIDVDLNKLKKRISEAENMKIKFLEILN